MALTLGGVLLDGFEAPAGLRFGGDQALAVHRLPGGARIIDAMGPDDADIVWRGYLSGADATDRARLLDTMRQAGAAVTLGWDDSSYNVVIARLRFVYSGPWWIQYDISCTVVSTGIGNVASGVQEALALVTSDLDTAAAWTSVSAASAAIGVSGAAVAGTQANATAAALIAAASAQVESGMEAAGNGLASADIGSLTISAGTLAELAAARGFVGRAGINLANAGG